MSGRLIILPKKSWHVWNREAIAKVRNDEKKHQEEVEATNERQRNLEAESRLDLLRSRAIAVPPQAPISSTPSALSSAPPSVVSSAAIPHQQSQLQAPNGHINLFADAEHAMGEHLEHKQEALAKERAEGKRTGYAALALGGTREEREKAAPWWGKFAEQGPLLSTPSTSAGVLPIVSSGLCPTPSVVGSSSTSLSVVVSSSETHGGHNDYEDSTTKKKKNKHKRDSKSKRESKKTHKKKRHKKESKKRSSPSSRSSGSESGSDSDDGEKTKRFRKSSSSASIPSIAELRTRRLEREHRESLRAGATLAKHVPPDDEEGSFIAGQATKRYNSQFFSTSGSHRPS